MTKVSIRPVSLTGCLPHVPGLLKSQWLSILGEHQSHLEGGLNPDTSSTLEFLIQCFWGRVQVFAYLTCPRWCWCCWFRNQTLRTSPEFSMLHISQAVFAVNLTGLMMGMAAESYLVPKMIKNSSFGSQTPIEWHVDKILRREPFCWCQIWCKKQLCLLECKLSIKEQKSKSCYFLGLGHMQQTPHVNEYNFFCLTCFPCKFIQGRPHRADKLQFHRWKHCRYFIVIWLAGDYIYFPFIFFFWLYK